MMVHVVHAPAVAHAPVRLLAVHGELVPVLLHAGGPEAEAGQPGERGTTASTPVHASHVQAVHRHRQRVDRFVF